MRITLILIFVFLLTELPAHAQQQINIRWDKVNTTVDAFGNTAEYNWPGIEIELGTEFKKDKLWIISGYTFGYRKEYDFAYGGNFIFVRTYKKIPAKYLDVTLSTAFVYGLPSTELNRSWQKHNGTDQTEYTRLYPLRGLNVPEDPIHKSGILYPEFTIGIRRKFLKIFHIEPITGIRVLKFGVVQSDFATSREKQITKITPVLGIRFSIIS